MGEGLWVKPLDKDVKIQPHLLMKGAEDGDSEKLNAQSWAGGGGFNESPTTIFFWNFTISL